MTWVIAVNTGHGFITHADKAKLSFKGYPGDVWEVLSILDPEVQQDISDWVTRVSGTTVNQNQADAAMFEATKYRYTLREFLREVLTTAELKWMLDNYDLHPAITAFMVRLLDNSSIDVSYADNIALINGLVMNGYLTQARADEILAGRTA